MSSAVVGRAGARDARRRLPSIDLGTGGYKPTNNPNDQIEVIWTTPRTSAGPVYGAKCSWQIADPSVQLMGNGATISLTGEVRNNAQFKLDKAGSFDATCTIGAARLTVTLKR